MSVRNDKAKGVIVLNANRDHVNAKKEVQDVAKLPAPDGMSAMTALRVRPVFGSAESILFRMDEVFGNPNLNQWQLDSMISALSKDTHSPQEVGALFSEVVQIMLRSGDATSAAEMLDGLSALRALSTQTDVGGDYYWAARSLGKGGQLEGFEGLSEMVFVASKGAAQGAVDLAEAMISSWKQSRANKASAGEPDAWGDAIAGQLQTSKESMKVLLTQLKGPDDTAAVRTLMERSKELVRFMGSFLGPKT